MDARDLFLERHNGLQEYPEYLLNGMSADQLRRSPGRSLNSIAWLLWHIARCEDLGVNRLVVDETQVLDGGWRELLRILDGSMGTGMTKDAADDLASRVEISELVAYRKAVSARTVTVVGSIPARHWAEKLTLDNLTRVLVVEGGGGSSGQDIAAQYDGQSNGWLLGHLALTHSFYHIGQAFSVRKILGYSNVW